MFIKLILKGLTVELRGERPLLPDHYSIIKEELRKPEGTQVPENTHFWMMAFAGRAVSDGAHCLFVIKALQNGNGKRTVSGCYEVCI
jgi:hypothetical protein